MNDKLVAGLTTVLVVAPVCSLCIIGPAVIVSFFAGFAAWLAPFDWFLTASLVVLTGLVAFGIARSRRDRRAQTNTAARISQ